MNLLLTVLTGALGALLGAWAGARAAFDRYRSERSFDRQVDWYERIARAIGRCVDTLDAALYLQSKSRFKDADVYWPRMSQCLMELGGVANESDLYAGPDGHQTLQQAILDLNRINREAEAQPPSLEVRTQMAERMLPVLRGARLVLSNELRRQLGLKPLTLGIGPGDAGVA